MVSIKDAVSYLQRQKTLGKEFRKFQTNRINSGLLTFIQAWWLHSRTQTVGIFVKGTVGAKFLRAGEKSVNRVTGAAVNVTGAAVNVMSYVNPVNVLGSWGSPFSSPAPEPNANAVKRGPLHSGREDPPNTDSSRLRLAKTLPNSALHGTQHESMQNEADDRAAEVVGGTPSVSVPVAAVANQTPVSKSPSSFAISFDDQHIPLNLCGTPSLQFFSP